MNLTIKGIRIIFIVVFLLISIGALLSAIYLIWLTAFGVGWGGGEISFVKLIWTWKGIIVLFIYSTTAFFGLLKPRKTGLIFGYPIPIGMSLYFFISMVDSTIYDLNSNHDFDFNYVLGLIAGTLVTLGIPILSIVGLNKIKADYFKFKTPDFVITGALAVILFLSWYFMFRI